MTAVTANKDFSNVSREWIADRMAGANNKIIELHAEIERLRAENAELRLARCEFDKCNRMAAALENARRDIFALIPQRGSKSRKRLLGMNAVERIEAALGVNQQESDRTKP